MNIPARRRLILSSGSFALLLLLCWVLRASAAPPGGGFIENRGQLDRAVRYLLPGATDFYFLQAGIMVDLKEPWSGGATSPTRRGCAVLVRFLGAGASPALTTEEPLGTRYSYFLGSDPTAWRADVPAFGELVYHDVWPGIDLAFRADGSALDYRVILGPGADGSSVAFAYDGAPPCGSTDLERVETPFGPLIHERNGLSGRFYRQVGEPGLRDNPGALQWSTLLGGNMGEQGTGVALDRSGNAVVTGATLSSNFPTTPGAYDTSFNGGIDIIVAKVSASGSALLWSTVIGGSGNEEGHALILDPSSGDVLITGHTDSANWPATPGAYDTALAGTEDVIVSRLSASGSTLLWSTFLGGSAAEEGNTIAVDSAGDAFLTGSTGSADFPTTPGAFQTSYGGGVDAFVTAVSADGSSLLWSSFLGGSGGEAGWKVVLDGSGNLALTGSTASADFPTTAGAYATSYGGGYSDAFAALVSSTGGSLLWSTFLGGSGDDNGYSLALDGSGNFVLTGDTGSSDFPTTPGGADSLYNGNDDSFVAKLSSAGSSLLWATFLGGSGLDVGYAVVLDAAGDPVVTGYTGSSDFPATPGAVDDSWNGWVDVFATSLTASGDHILWSTFLGGTGADYGNAIALDASESPVVVGVSGSSDFPTTPGAYDTTANGLMDIFVSKLEAGAMTTGTGSHGPSADAARWVPNPSSDGSTFHLTSASAAESAARLPGWSVGIFDASGRFVRRLDAGPAGVGAVRWDGRDDHGGQVKSGVYFYRVTIGSRMQARTGKLVIDR